MNPTTTPDHESQQPHDSATEATKASPPPPDSMSSNHHKPRAVAEQEFQGLIRIIRPPLAIALGFLAVVILAAIVWSIVAVIPTTTSAQGIMVAGGRLISVPATNDGVVVDIAISAEQTITAGQPLATMDTGSGQVPVFSAVGGRVAQINMFVGMNVEAGTTLVTLDNPSAPLAVEAFVPYEESFNLTTNMAAEVTPGNRTSAQSGFIEGTVTNVQKFPTSENEVADEVGSSVVAQELLSTGPVVQVSISLTQDPSNPTGLKWSDGANLSQPVYSGMPVSVSIIQKQQHPIELVLK